MALDNLRNMSGLDKFFTFGMPAIETVLGTTGRMANGESIVPAAIKSGTEAIVSDTLMGFLVAPQLQMPYMAAQFAAMGANVALEAGKKNVTRAQEAFGGAGMYGKTQIHSKNAQSMRQRGMAMINDNGDVVRSAFGSEARAYYRSAF